MAKVCVTGAAGFIGGHLAEALLEPKHEAPRAGDLRASSADLTKARKMLGFEPRVTLAAGLADLVRSWRKTLRTA